MVNSLTLTSSNGFHVPVMANEILHYLSPVFSKCKTEKILFIDATIGGGGHTEKILQHFEIDLVVGIDWDKDAIEYCQQKFAKYKNIYLFNKNYTELDHIVRNFPSYKVRGVLFDYGVSLYHLKTPARGFSYQLNGILDMRFSQNGTTQKAQDLIRKSSIEYLTKIFKVYGEERFARRIASAVYKHRKEINTTQELADIIKSVVPSRFYKKALARIFQALRIAVNDELNNIQSALQKAISVLSPCGRILCISYHSLEDRLVKNIFKSYAQLKALKLITKKPITPQPEEMQTNPRARSAKLRVAEKLTTNENV
ncbi:MAG: 16S rRNA (cytosine(1402)-N(4))-methyltransferase RsmH [candidate division WOR-3 bacterium]